MKNKKSDKRAVAGAGTGGEPVPAGSGASGRPSGFGGLRLLAIVLLAAALAISFYLVRLSFLGGSAAGCGPESGCGEVLKSRWSVLFGVPVGLFGAGVYGFLLCCAVLLGGVTRGQRRLEVMASVAVVAGALWFAGVQLWVLKAFCPWCGAAHASATAGVVALWWARRRGGGLVPDPLVPAFMAVSLVAVAGMALVQSFGPAPERIQQAASGEAVVASDRGVALYGGQVRFDPASLPSIGVTPSGLTTVALTDFTCPHCRELHRTLEQLADERPGQFNTVLLPAAFEPGAREIHRLMLALWRLEPARYREMAEALVEGSIDPTPEAVLARIQQQLGATFHERAWAEAGWVQDTLKLGEQLLALNAKEATISTLPQLMIGDRVLAGAPQAATVVSLIEAAVAAGPATLAATEAAPAPAVAVAPAPAVAAAPASETPAPGGSAPVIQFESTTVDLGQVTRGESVTRRVSFTNTGGSPLTLKNIKAGCGCTTVDGWKQTVPPGEQGSFELKFDSANFLGLTTKTVTVESDATNGSVPISLKADVWAPVRLSTSSVSFGRALKGATVEPKQVEITVTDDQPLTLSGVTSRNPYFQASLEPIEAGRRYRLTVSVPEVGDKSQSGELVLALGHAKMPEMKLQAHINPVDPVSVQPRQVVVPMASLAAGTTTNITVYSHDPAVKNLEVSDLAYSGAAGVQLSYEKKPANPWGRVVMTFPAGYIPRAEIGEFLTFRTNHPDFAEVKVPVVFTTPRLAPGKVSGTGAAIPPAGTR